MFCRGSTGSITRWFSIRKFSFHFRSKGCDEAPIWYKMYQMHAWLTIYNTEQKLCTRLAVFMCFSTVVVRTWWRHQMETFSALLAICAGNSPVPVNSPHKGQWRGALMFSLICAWISGWVNNRGAGDSRRNHAHNDVIVMKRLSLYPSDLFHWH